MLAARPFHIVAAGRHLRRTAQRDAEVPTVAVRVLQIPAAVFRGDVEVAVGRLGRGDVGAHGPADVRIVGRGHLVPRHAGFRPCGLDGVAAHNFRVAGIVERADAERCGQHRVGSLQADELVELDQRNALAAGSGATAHQGDAAVVGVGILLPDVRIADGDVGRRGLHDGVDRHGIGRAFHECRINDVFHANIFAHVGQNDGRENLFAVAVIDVGTAHNEARLAGFPILHAQLGLFRHFVVVVLRQANGRAGQGIGAGEDDILLERFAADGVTDGYAGQHAFVGVLGIQPGQRRAPFLRILQFDGQIGGFEALQRAADELRKGPGHLDQPLLLHLKAGAHCRENGLRLLLKAPREGVVAVGDGGHAAAVHANGELHPNAARVVAEHSAANGRDCLLQRVVDVLPFAGLRIAEMDRFGVNDRLMNSASKVKYLRVLFAQTGDFLAGHLIEQ